MLLRGTVLNSRRESQGFVTALQFFLTGALLRLSHSGIAGCRRAGMIARVELWRRHEPTYDLAAIRTRVNRIVGYSLEYCVDRSAAFALILVDRHCVTPRLVEQADPITVARSRAESCV